ncbi:MAG: hypothetical protein ACFFEV_07130, partial [Candidatus Thorarchaeota archaeon]
QRLIRILDARPREFQAHLLPWQGHPENTHTDNVILIGDAGGFPCPLEAEGIYPAMVTARAAIETAAEAIATGDTSKDFLSLYDKKWKATSVGDDFISGKELASIWMQLPFSPRKSMTWFVPMFMEILGGIIDWSEAHPVRIRQVTRQLKKYLPQAVPFIMKEVIPLLTSVLGEEKMEMLTDPAKLMEEMPEIQEAMMMAFMDAPKEEE